MTGAWLSGHAAAVSQLRRWCGYDRGSRVADGGPFEEAGEREPRGEHERPRPPRGQPRPRPVPFDAAVARVGLASAPEISSGTPEIAAGVFVAPVNSTTEAALSPCTFSPTRMLLLASDRMPTKLSGQ